MSTSARIANGKLIIEVDLESTPFQRTQGGKGNNLMVATTSGFAKTDVKIEDKTVSVSVNAIIKA